LLRSGCGLANSRGSHPIVAPNSLGKRVDANLRTATDRQMTDNP